MVTRELLFLAILIHPSLLMSTSIFASIRIRGCVVGPCVFEEIQPFFFAMELFCRF